MIKPASVLMVVILVASPTTVFGQSASITTFTGNAEATFDKYSSETSLAVLCPLTEPVSVGGRTVTVDQSTKAAELMLEATKLVEIERSPKPFWGGKWGGRNNTGTVSLYVSCSNVFTPNQHIFTLLYYPPNESRVPDSVLSWMFSKADTQVSGADTAELEFRVPWLGQSKCSSHRKYTIRISTGALVGVVFQTTCQP